MSSNQQHCVGTVWVTEHEQTNDFLDNDFKKTNKIDYVRSTFSFYSLRVEQTTSAWNGMENCASMLSNRHTAIYDFLDNDTKNQIDDEEALYLCNLRTACIWYGIHVDCKIQQSMEKNIPTFSKYKLSAIHMFMFKKEECMTI